MIERILGKLIKIDFPNIVILVNGIGYELAVSANTMAKLPELHRECQLLTKIIYREDSQTIYGFNSELEREYFKTLLKVSSVGPKMSMAILSIYEPSELQLIVSEDNISALSRVPGIGNKKSQRLIFELKTLIKTTSAISSSNIDAYSALIALGYKQNEVHKIIKSVEPSTKSTEQIITESLKLLSKA